MYGTVRFRLRPELEQAFLNFVVSRTKLRDARAAAELATFARASAQGDEYIYLALAQLLKLFNLDNCEGDDLDERGRDFDVERIGAQPAQGSVQFIRGTSEGTFSYPAGTIVGRASANVTYRTTEALTFLDTQTVSSLVPILAEVAGEAGNAEPRTVTRLVTRLAGVTSVVNPSGVVGGVDKEKDDAYRQRIKDKLRSLSRSTPRALEIIARGVTTDAGRRVLFARLIESITQPGVGTLWIDDGAGTAGSTETIAAEEIIMDSAAGGERRFYLRRYPVQPGATFTLLLNDVALTEGTDYHLHRMTGTLTLDETAYPSGLTAADELKVTVYTYYTDLVAQTQWVINGLASNFTLYPGARGFGSHVTVRPALPNYVTVTCTPAVLPGYDRAVVVANVRAAIITYLNSLGIEEDVIRHELVERIMGVRGVTDVLLEAPAANIPINEGEVARALASLIGVT